MRIGEKVIDRIEAGDLATSRFGPERNEWPPIDDAYGANRVG